MTRPSLAWLARGSFAVSLLASSAWSALAEPTVDYNRDIRPILSNNCFKCHGFDEAERQADLRLDTREGAVAELLSGAQAVVPGDSEISGLVERITAEDKSMRMPPPATGKTLKPEEIELLKRWIDEGGEYRAHWAFIPPERPVPPAVAHEQLVRNEIDRFILARLEKEGLEPSPEADKETLIRRVTLDLTGLPTTPAEIDAFLADDSQGAYERLVDRLLASPGTASTWHATGSTRPATATRTACTSTTSGRSGPTATGSSRPSTATSPSTSSRSSNWPATFCPNRRSTSGWPRDSIAATYRPARGARSTTKCSSAMPSTAWRRPPPSGWG